MSNGYIYIRTHTAYDAESVCKLGKTDSIPNRDTQYATGEIKRGIFALVLEMPVESVGIVERMLQKYFNSMGLHIQFDGGTEFYKNDIIELVVPYMEKTNIVFRVLTQQEITDLTRRKYLHKLQKLVLAFRMNRAAPCKFVPREDQDIIIGKSIEHFKVHNKGMLILMCGVGKTLISLWVAQRLKSKTICIGVPNLLLLKQWRDVVRELFPNVPILLVSGSIKESNIIAFTKGRPNFIIITTYASSYKVTAVKVDLKILDEVHHLTSHNLKAANGCSTYVQMLRVVSDKQLSLTATMKQIEGGGDNIVSNDNEEQFGQIIDRKCLLWAINANVICDYVIQTIMANEEQLQEYFTRFNIRIEQDQRLFLSAYASLKSIYDGHSHHLLIYANNRTNSAKLVQYVNLLLDNDYFNIDGLYYSNYHSEMNFSEQTNIINKFETAKHGIIMCVYCLGEGWDFPLLDGVVFAENMTSTIRIVQSALRASRKNRNDPNKKTKIILPILNRDEWLDNDSNTDLMKVREVIYQMGLEDETIAQKIKSCSMTIEKHTKSQSKVAPTTYIDTFGDYDDEFTKRLRLKTVNRMAIGTTYEKARKIIHENQVKNKEDYMELCERDIRLSKDPETMFAGQFTNWLEYLGIQRVYYDLDDCKKKVSEYSDQIRTYYMDLSKACSELCKLDQRFPPNGMWVEYYNVKDLRNIISVAPTKKKITSDII